MPGIVGIISKSSLKKCITDIRRMVFSISLETFYNSGINLYSDMQIYIGWACHSGGFTDCMPIYNESKEIALFLSGEVFQDTDVIQDLRSNGHKFSEKDASYLVHLYEEEGDNFFSELNGLFSGVIVDCRIGKVFLFNDRYGLQRLFIHENEDAFYFSSEAKALLAVLPETRKFDPKGLAEFLTCGCTLESSSLFKDLNIFPAGSVWIFRNGDLKERIKYFDFSELADQGHIDRKMFSKRFEDLFGRVVKRYKEGSLPIGISLTGGLDTRMLMACLDMGADKLPCYTFGSMFRDSFDVIGAREVAKACGQKHQVVILGEEFLHDFPNYLEKAVYISDGYIGLSGAAELYVNSIARNLAPVRLTGDYGGEVLHGVRAFKSVIPRSGFVNPELDDLLIEAKNTFQKLVSADPETFTLSHQAQSQAYGRLAVIRSQVVHRTPFMDNDLIKLIYKAPPHFLAGTEPYLSVISRYKPNLLKIPTDRGLLGNCSRITSLARQFRYEALFKAEYWSSHGMPNYLAAFSCFRITGMLRRMFLGRHKFQHFNLWTQERLSEYINDVYINDSNMLEDIINLQQVKKMLQEHMSGRRNYLSEIDKILSLILVQRMLFKGTGFEKYGSKVPIRYSRK